MAESRLSTGEKNQHAAIHAAVKPLPEVETEAEVVAAVVSKDPGVVAQQLGDWNAKSEAIRNIDYTNLEDAIFAHLSLFQQITGPLPLARKNLAVAKLDLDRMKALIDIEIRETTASQGGKITEAAIASKIASDPRVYKSTRDYLSSKEVLDELEHNKDVMFQREQTIRNLIALKRADWTAASTF